MWRYYKKLATNRPERILASDPVGCRRHPLLSRTSRDYDCAVSAAICLRPDPPGRPGYGPDFHTIREQLGPSPGDGFLLFISARLRTGGRALGAKPLRRRVR